MYKAGITLVCLVALLCTWPSTASSALHPHYRFSVRLSSTVVAGGLLLLLGMDIFKKLFPFLNLWTS